MFTLSFFSTVPSFNFTKDCFVCGYSCNVTSDPKHPDRWERNPERNPEILCRTADRGKDKEGRTRKSFKDVLLEICRKRDDILGDTVMVRLHGAPSDLHAADARLEGNMSKR